MPGGPRDQVLDSFKQFPRIQNVNSIVGTTDYVDLITEGDMQTGGVSEPVFYFEDLFQRRGLALRVWVCDAITKSEVDRGIFAMFERYSPLADAKLEATRSSLYVLCRSHKVKTKFDGVWSGKFHVILGANTAMTDVSFAILDSILQQHRLGLPYITQDGLFEVHLVHKFPA